MTRPLFDADALRELVNALVDQRMAELQRAAKRTDSYVSVQEAARIAEVAEGTVRRWIREGRLKRYRAGRETRVMRADLDDLLSDETPSTLPERRRNAGRFTSRELSPEERAERDFA